MFKHYLTYEFALGFERDCSVLNLPPRIKQELSHCSTNMVNFFDLALRATKTAEKSKNIFVALTYLRDCREVLKAFSKEFSEIEGKYEVLQLRFERLCMEASEGERGQLRMLG